MPEQDDQSKHSDLWPTRRLVSARERELIAEVEDIVTKLQGEKEATGYLNKAELQKLVKRAEELRDIATYNNFIAERARYLRARTRYDHAATTYSGFLKDRDALRGDVGAVSSDINTSIMKLLSEQEPATLLRAYSQHMKTSSEPVALDPRVRAIMLGAAIAVLVAAISRLAE